MVVLLTVLVYVVFLVSLVSIILAVRKKRYYIVFTAEPRKQFLSRNLLEWEVSGTVVFRDDENRRVIIPKHWIIKIVELKKEDIETVKADPEIAKCDLEEYLENEVG